MLWYLAAAAICPTIIVRTQEFQKCQLDPTRNSSESGVDSLIHYRVEELSYPSTLFFEIVRPTEAHVGFQRDTNDAFDGTRSWLTENRLGGLTCVPVGDHKICSN